MQFEMAHRKYFHFRSFFNDRLKIKKTVLYSLITNEDRNSEQGFETKVIREIQTIL